MSMLQVRRVYHEFTNVRLPLSIRNGESRKQMATSANPEELVLTPGKNYKSQYKHSWMGLIQMLKYLPDYKKEPRQDFYFDDH